MSQLLRIQTRYYGGTYIARAGKLQASCTSSAERAALRVAEKHFGQRRGKLRILKHVILDGVFFAETTEPAESTP